MIQFGLCPEMHLGNLRRELADSPFSARAALVAAPAAAWQSPSPGEPTAREWGGSLGPRRDAWVLSLYMVCWVQVLATRGFPITGRYQKQLEHRASCPKVHAASLGSGLRMALNQDPAGNKVVLRA